jgi:hypothetical protein
MFHLEQFAEDCFGKGTSVETRVVSNKIRGVVFRLPPLRGKFSMFPLFLIRFKNFWIVLLFMPVIFCII